MTITGKAVFKMIYIVSFIFHSVFISYQLSQSASLDKGYLVVAFTTIIAMTLILISIEYDNWNKNKEDNL